MHAYLCGIMKKVCLDTHISKTPSDLKEPSLAPYSFRQIEILSGPKLNLKPMRSEDLAPVGQALVSATTWFSRTRNISNVESFSEYFMPLLERQKRSDMF